VKVVEMLAAVAAKLIDLLRTVVMTGWGPVLRLVVMLAVITALIVVGTLGVAASR
jgi:hypothetical protein